MRARPGGPLGPPALTGSIWCQLFSEPGAGSDAAGIRTRAAQVDGGWLDQRPEGLDQRRPPRQHGLATVRTDPEAPKHQGITTMVIDMQAPGVDVRPLREATGGAEFNEVFFDDVFVPDDDVVGPVDGGWTVARATLGNESVSIGGGEGGGQAVSADADRGVRRPSGAAVRRRGPGRPSHRPLRGLGVLNLRSVHRAVAGGGPGPRAT